MGVALVVPGCERSNGFGLDPAWSQASMLTALSIAAVDKFVYVAGITRS